MLCTFCPPTIWATSLGFCRNRPESSADNVYRACETKDQTLKKIRTSHFPDRPKFSGPDIFRWGRGLPHEGVGAKKFGMCLETREIKFFWRKGISRRCPKSLRKKSQCSVFGPYFKRNMQALPGGNGRRQEVSGEYWDVAELLFQKTPRSRLIEQ